MIQEEEEESSLFQSHPFLSFVKVPEGASFSESWSNWTLASQATE